MAPRRCRRGRTVARKFVSKRIGVTKKLPVKNEVKKMSTRRKVQSTASLRALLPLLERTQQLRNLEKTMSTDRIRHLLATRERTLHKDAQTHIRSPIKVSRIYEPRYLIQGSKFIRRTVNTIDEKVLECGAAALFVKLNCLRELTQNIHEYSDSESDMDVSPSTSRVVASTSNDNIAPVNLRRGRRLKNVGSPVEKIVPVSRRSHRLQEVVSENEPPRGVPVLSVQRLGGGPLRGINGASHVSVTTVATNSHHEACILCNQQLGAKMRCSSCRLQFHPSCLRVVSNFVTSMLSQPYWKCAACICCESCGRFIDDYENVECAGCGIAWHGRCRPANSSFEKQYLCRKCNPQEAATVITSPNKRQIGRSSGAGRGGRQSKNVTPATSPSAEPSVRGKRGRPASVGSVRGRRELNKSFLKCPTREDARDHVRVHYSSYEMSIRRADVSFERCFDGAVDIFVCPYCLDSYIIDAVHFEFHQAACRCVHPPGKRIYTDGEVAFYELDGAAGLDYCHNLCVLAKFFIASKEALVNFANFMFYVLTEIDENGRCRLVGYFSKEKHPVFNYNLSCILTLPCYQKRGFGSLMIDLSYELSRRERKIGGPEHPLSNEGFATYTKYWRSAILNFLRQLPADTHEIAIKDISLATRINPRDIVTQMLRDDFFTVIQNGTVTTNGIQTTRRAFVLPLCASRRRGIRRELLRWRPPSACSSLDPSTLNVYSEREYVHADTGPETHHS